MNPVKKLIDARFCFYQLEDGCEITSRFLAFRSMYILAATFAVVLFVTALSGLVIPRDHPHWSTLMWVATILLLFLTASGWHYPYKQVTRIIVSEQRITIDRHSVLRRHASETITYRSIKMVRMEYASFERISVHLYLIYDNNQMAKLTPDAIWSTGYESKISSLVNFLNIPLQGPS